MFCKSRMLPGTIPINFSFLVLRREKKSPPAVICWNLSIPPFCLLFSLQAISFRDSFSFFFFHSNSAHGREQDLLRRWIQIFWHNEMDNKHKSLVQMGREKSQTDEKERDEQQGYVMDMLHLEGSL